MPNWTYNILRVEKGDCDLRMYGTTDEDGKMRFDFDKIVPQPRSATECALKYGSQYLDTGNKHLQHTDEDAWFDWYGWHCDFWGTKWNACDSYIEDDGQTVSFDTAWTEPEPIWKAISKAHPECVFHVDASYEEGFETESTWRSGVRIRYSERECDYDE